MTREENIRAILECYFTGFKEEIIDGACERICELEYKPYICDTCKNKENGWDTEPCDGCCKNHSGYAPTDAISRDAVWGIIMRSDFVDRFTYQEFTKKLDALPNVPVTPQKSGKWIEHPEIETSTPEYLMFYECSECGDKQCFCKSDIHKKHFCNNCGAKMVEGSDPE